MKRCKNSIRPRALCHLGLLLFGVCILLACPDQQYFPDSDNVTIKWQRLKLIDVIVNADSTVDTFDYKVTLPDFGFKYIMTEFSKVNEDSTSKDSASLLQDWVHLDSINPIKNTNDAQNFYTYRVSDYTGSLKDLLDSCHEEADIKVGKDGDLALFFLYIHRLRDYYDTTHKYAGAYVADSNRLNDTTWHGETKAAVAIYTIADTWGDDWWDKCATHVTAHEIGHCFMMGHCGPLWSPTCACIMDDTLPSLDLIDEYFSDTFCTVHVRKLKTIRP